MPKNNLTISDIDKQVSVLIREYVQGNNAALGKVLTLQKKREEMLLTRKKTSDNS